MFKSKLEKAEAKAAKEARKAEAKRVREAAEREKEAGRRRKAFLATPGGRAHTAREQGHRVFQFLEVVSRTEGTVIPMIGTSVSDEGGPLGVQKVFGTADRVMTTAIEEIESQGWRLVNAGYVFQHTHSRSRDKFLASGQQEAVSGRVLGIYTFRRDPAAE